MTLEKLHQDIFMYQPHEVIGVAFDYFSAVLKDAPSRGKKMTKKETDKSESDLRALLSCDICPYKTECKVLPVTEESNAAMVIPIETWPHAKWLAVVVCNSYRSYRKSLSIL